MTHPPGTQSEDRRTPLSSEEKARGEVNLAPFVAQMLVARGRFRVSADTPDQVELFQGVARRVSDLLQRPVASYANGREIVITFGQQEAPVLALRSPGLFPQCDHEISCLIGISAHVRAVMIVEDFFLAEEKRPRRTRSFQDLLHVLVGAHTEPTDGAGETPGSARGASQEPDRAPERGRGVAG